jgi:hypothetical protein
MGFKFRWDLSGASRFYAFVAQHAFTQKQKQPLFIPILSIIILNMRTHNFNLSNALFSKVRQNVLALFFSDPTKSFHTNEIIRLIKAGTGSVQRELEKLSSVGLIDVKIIGNQKHYSANPDSPIFSELHNLLA